MVQKLLNFKSMNGLRRVKLVRIDTQQPYHVKSGMSDLFQGQLRSNRYIILD